MSCREVCRNRWFRQRWVASSLLLTLAGCAVLGPDYQAPVLSETEVPAQWSSPAETSAQDELSRNGPASTVSWWTELADPALDQLVNEAFASSPTLEAAVAKLRQSQSYTRQAKAAGSPVVDGSTSSERAATDASGNGTTESGLSINSSWEIDLFGALKRGKEGAQAREEAQRATLADARISLAADVTDAYLSHRACQSQLRLSEEDLASRTATEKLTAHSVEVGFTAPYEGIRSMASVAEAKSRLTAARAKCERLENLLTRLTGVTRPKVAAILANKPTGLDRLPEPRHFSIAIPSKALMQRPDVRAAERRVAAASADIGLAEADRYPRLTLNGALGYSVEGSGGSGALSFGTWSFGPSLSLPIFDGGRRAANVRIAQSKYDEALADFKAKARSAIHEVEDALTRYAAAHERAENARLADKKYQQFFRAVEGRYREGASNLLELEDARRVRLDAEQTLLSVQQERLQAWVALNRATGGGAQYDAQAPQSDESATLASPATPDKQPTSH